MTPHTPSWATALLGERAVCTRVICGGTSRTTLLLAVPPRSGGVVARYDAGAGPLARTPFTLRREAAAYAAAAAADLPVPAVVATAEDGRSFAVEEVAGSVDRTAEALDDYLRVLGALHATGIDHAPTGHAGFDPAGRDDLEVWRTIAETLVVRPAPLLTFAFDALERHAALDGIERPVFCHGDAGFGNYLHLDDRVTGLVDWEMAHTGDAHDDLASVAVRAVLSGIDLGDYRARIVRHWEPASGMRFDQRRFDLGAASTLTRMVVSCLVALDHPRADTDRTVQLMGLPIMEIHLLRVLALLDGVALDALPEAPLDDEFAAEMARLLEEPLPSTDDPGIARRRRYLADKPDFARSGPVPERAKSPLVRSDFARSGPVPERAKSPIEELSWKAAGRLRAVAASRPLAEAPIAGLGPR